MEFFKHNWATLTNHPTISKISFLCRHTLVLYWLLNGKGKDGQAND